MREPAGRRIHVHRRASLRGTLVAAPVRSKPAALFRPRAARKARACKHLAARDTRCHDQGSFIQQARDLMAGEVFTRISERFGRLGFPP